MYKEWKAIEYLNRLGSTIHKEVEILEDQWRDGGTRFRSQNGPMGSTPCSCWLRSSEVAPQPVWPYVQYENV